ncbi:hypothetical protein HS125_13615 [bacterium]|nr:hypothetical protein [bacterium]
MTIEDMKNNQLAQQILVQLKINISKLVLRSQGPTLYIKGVLIRQDETPAPGSFKSNKRLVPLVEQRLLAERAFRRIMWDLE